MAHYEQEKVATEVLDWGINWADWLASGETISTSTWSADSGITVDSSSNSTTATTVVLSGGTAGDNYKVVNTITTTGGSVARTGVRTLNIEVVSDKYE